MKYKVKTKDCRLVVRVKASFGESFDTKELDRFERAYLRGFLKPKQVRKNVVDYTGPVAIPLSERMKKPITKKDFYFILEQLVVAVRKLDGSNLSLNSLVLDMQNVYINEITKEIQFLYIPVIKQKNSWDLIEFIESVIYSSQPGDIKDQEFVSRFVYFFKSLKPFNIERIEQYIAKEDKDVVVTIKKQNSGQSGFITNKQKEYYDYLDEVDADAPTGMLIEEDATGRLEGNDEETDCLGYDSGMTSMEDDEATGYLAAPEAKPNYGSGNARVSYPKLIRVLTQEIVEVNKPVYRLGKERSYVDYFVANNNVVSRSHADIITRESRYYVIDLNSKNHTYVNGIEIPVLQEIEVHDGDQVRLGNEEFIFQVL